MPGMLIKFLKDTPGRLHTAMALLAAALMVCSAARAQADHKLGQPRLPDRPVVVSARLYVLDCGTLIYNRPEDYGLSREEVASSNMSVSCYLVVHPKGTLLFDTGLSDTLVGRPIFENPIYTYSQLKLNTLRGQLAEIGYRPDQIDYLALSHGHVDHIANVHDYLTATWLTPRAERDFMFTPAARKSFYFHQYAKLESAPTKIFEGDLDVFGDGSVILKSTPGHTPGHQCLWVRLARTGGVLLSGDMYHYAEERSLARMPEHEKAGANARSRAAMEQFMRETSSQLWIGHDIGLFQRLAKAPAWYD